MSIFINTSLYIYLIFFIVSINSQQQNCCRLGPAILIKSFLSLIQGFLPLFFFFLKKKKSQKYQSMYILLSELPCRRLITAELQSPSSGHWQGADRMGASHKRRHTAGFRSCEMSRIDKSIETESRLVVAQGLGEVGYRHNC